MVPPNGLTQVANANAGSVDPQSMLRQIDELAVCVDEITTQTALTSLTTMIEAATGDAGRAARAGDVAAETADGAAALENHIRRLLAAAAAL